MFFYFLDLVNKNTLNCCKYNPNKTHYGYFIRVLPVIIKQCLQKLESTSQTQLN
jgi:hypothetical protein